MPVSLLTAGCDRQAPSQVRGAEAAPASGPATQASQPGREWATRDYVANPEVDPSEREAGPRRIISMAPSATELCWALGLGERLVGRTQYCIYPPAAQKVEMVGALLDPNVERVLQLQPDLVLITASSGMLKEKFASLKLPMRILPDSSLEDIFAAITQLGEVVGRPKTAAMLRKNLRADLDRLRERARRSGGGSRVLFVTGALTNPPRNVWVAGPGSYIDELLTLTGCRNAVEGDRAWLEIGAEQVLWMRPEVIVEVREAAQAGQRAEAVAAWRQLPGMSKVCFVTLEEIGVVFPGPRVNVMLGKVIGGLYGNDRE